LKLWGLGQEGFQGLGGALERAGVERIVSVFGDGWLTSEDFIKRGESERV
jgi:hypothetical protein